MDENFSVNLEPYCGIYTEKMECSNFSEAHTQGSKRDQTSIPLQ